MDNLADRISQLSPEQLAQLTQKLQQKQPQMRTIPVQPRDTQTFPLSFAQQRLWFLHQLQPENPFYNVPTAVQVAGPLNVSVLERSLTALCDRHEPLRTVFGLDSNQLPVQVIQSTSPWSLEVIDLQMLAPKEQQQKLEQFKVEIATTPFDLTQGPLLRTRLLQLAPETYILYICIHHIVVDGWALQLFVQELSVLYQAFRRSLPSPLKPLKIQYVDYIVWQQQQLQQDSSNNHLQYWLQQLDGVPTVLELPTDYPRPPIQSLKGARYPLKLGSSLTQALKQLGQTEGTTLFMTVLAAFNVLLYRYTGQTDLLVGSPVANRNQVAIEGLIGLLANTLALRTQLQGEDSFRQLLQRVKTSVVDANAHQDLPFEQLVEAMHLQRSRSYAPLIQVLLTFETAPMEKQICGDLVLQPEFLSTEATQFDLSLHLVDTTEGLQGSWEYNTDIFAATTIHRISNHLQMILETIVSTPDCSIDDISLLTPSEREKILSQWNKTQVSFPQAGIHQLFEQQVARTPDAVAVVFDQESLSYGELNTRANQLAHYLQSAGVGPDTLVGLCLERSIDMVVGLLGILKAGGAYVPLDPGHPPERLRFMLEDAAVSILVTQAALVQILPSHSARLICLEDASETIAGYPAVNPKSPVNALNLAYVIYTSGSTGQPKGVMNQHHGVCNRLLWMQSAYQLTPEDRVLQKTPFSFDVSVWEFFWPLMVGARLVVARPEGHKDPDYLTTVLMQERITTVHFVPSMLAAFLHHRSRLPLPHLKRVICSGEALPAQLQTAFFEQVDPASCELHNLYGPTEAAIDVTAWQCQPDSGGGHVPIGCPIANTQIYLLTRHLQPVPIGVAGELHIGGVGLARGYLKRATLTAEKFIPNPFGEGRLYKTGDLARYRVDGNIEFLGRIDYQVKLRGFRIELGEIEAALAQCQYIQSSVVVLREDHPGNQQLVAYIVSDHEPDPKAVRAHLQQHLPAYMVPSVLVPLEELPLTPNGKINRRILPVPTYEADQTQQFVAPKTERQQQIAALIADVLSIPVERIGIYDSFFDLGGHSLLATQLVARLRKKFEVDFPLDVLFERSAIADIDLALTTYKGQKSSVPTIMPADRDGGDIPLSYAQERLWFLDQLTGTSAIYNIPGAIQIEGSLDVAVLQQAIAELVKRHEVLRTTFPVVGETAVQHIIPDLSVPLNVIDASGLSGSLADWLSKEANHPFDLTTGPLLRMTLLRMQENTAVLAVTMHHVISDGWSIAVLIQELAAFYNSYRQQQPTALSPLPVQYADYSLWQRQWLQGEVLQQQLAYWQQQLAGAPTLLELPTDYPRPAVQSFQGKSHRTTLPEDLTVAIKNLTQQQGVTLFMVLIAAFQLLLARYSNQQDIVVGSPIANRQQAEIEGLIGCFVNTLVLRTIIDTTATVADLLQQVRRVALEAYAHQDLPFEQVVEALSAERTLAHTPLFQVMFILQNTPTAPLELDGITLTPLQTETVTAKFDLTLSMQETEQGLVGYWEYNSDLFKAETIAQMATHFEILLGGMVADVHQSVATLPLLTPHEQQQQLIDWNSTTADYPLEQCLHKLFEQQAQRTPDAVAVAFEQESLSYGELNHRANQLAHYLQELGVGAETLVGICVERSIEMFVALLGVLKAGGAYVPLDPQYPQQRLAYMIDDAGLEILLSQSLLLDIFPDYLGKIICLDKPLLTAVSSPLLRQHQPQLPAAFDNLAYVIYTSGSTGRPKGVQIPHRAVVNFLHAQQQCLQLNAQDRLLAVTSLSFDIAVLELFLPLMVGGRVVLASRDIATDGVRLADYLQVSGATIMQATPATWRMLLNGGWTGASHLRILCGGEALASDLATALRSRCASLWNLYGPTETTIWSIQQEIKDDAPIAIGRPIANTQLYILDTALQPVPVGVSGELYIGGAGLSRGYLNRPQLTAEKFVVNPFGEGRLYKTGDLARYHSGGVVEFLGRLDHQIKLRGFRIELSEIETVLNGLPQLEQSVVMVREDKPGNAYLVAYVIPQSVSSSESADTREATNFSGTLVSDEPTHHLVSQLRTSLQAKLPDYMVPSAFVLLKALPLTPNGKVDRKALPVPTSQHIRSEEFVAPQTEQEMLLAESFAKVLGLSVEQVGIHDSFFELGGHSLLATQLVTHLRQTLGVKLPLRQLFTAATIADLAVWLADQQQSSEALRTIVPMPREQSIPLSFAQERLWFIDQLDPGNTAYNQSVAVRLTGHLNVTAFRKSLQAIVDRHEILRTTFVLSQGQPTQKIAPTLAAVLSVVTLVHMPPTQQQEAVIRLAHEADQQSFDLTQGPLFRTSVLQLSEQEHVLLWSTHHIISDVWSIGVLIRDLATFYTAHVNASQPLLEPLPIQYADFAMWQRQWLTGDVLEQQLGYWRQKLGGKLPVLRLPMDYPPPAEPSFRGATENLRLSIDLTNKLQSLSQDVGTTLFMTLLAGFKALLYTYTGQHDIVVGTDIANRNRAEIEDLIGFFVNLLVLRTDLSNNPRFCDLLQQVREVALEAYDQQDLPFAKLVQALQTPTEEQQRGGNTPLFQVLFVMQNAPLRLMELPNLTLAPMDLEAQFAKFALALFVNETPEGISIVWNYSTDRFAAKTIGGMARRFETLLQRIVDQPDVPLETLATSFAQQQPMQKGTKRRKKFKRVVPLAVQQSATDVVTMQPLSCGVLTIQPSHENSDLVSWAKEQRVMLNQKLHQQGALLFRGFSISTAQDFEQAASAICPDLFGEYGDLPRTGVSDKVYGSTPYPEDKAILFHNESSHLQQWPMKIWFCCLQPSQQGGETPIVDCRQIYQSLSPDVRDRIQKKQLMYVRNYIKGLDVDWQDFFHTTERSVVEQRCQAAGVEWEWLADDGLQTRQVRPAVVRHPHTGEWVVFNQLQLHHLSYLDAPTQQSLLSLFGEDRLPRQVYYGDGSPIEPEILEALQAAYKQAEKVFPWQKGDILMLDNMLMAHGRNAYVGPRKITVAMGEIMTESKLLEMLSNSD